MKPKFRHLRSLAIASSALFAISYAHAATYSWNVDAAGNWSLGANWSPSGVPLTVAGDTINLTNNISGARQVTIDNTSRTIGFLNIGDLNNTHAFTLASSGGARLTFDNGGSGATITETGSTQDIISAGLILADDLTVNVGGSLSMSGLIFGTGDLLKTGTGTLTLGNVVNQFTGNTVITNGKVALGGQYSMWQSAYDTTGSTGAIGLNVTGQAAPWLGGLAGSVNLATAITGYGSVTSLTLNPQAGASVSYGGVIANGSGAMTLNKSGHGTQILTGANTYTGATTVWAGTLALSGASGSALNSAFTVRGGTLELDNSGGTFIDRLTNGTALSLGSLNLKSYNGAGAQTETVGATTFAVGGKVTITNGTTVGDQTTLAMGAVTRSVGAAINFVGVNGTLGSGANSPNVTSTGAFPSIQNNILPWATVGGTQWAENNAGSIRAYSGTFTTLALATNTTQAQQTGAATLAGALNTNSLNVISDGSSNILALGGNTISFGSTNVAGTLGAILKSGTNAYTISGGTIRVGTAGAGTELITHVDGGALTISANLNTTINSIAKGGTGDLILSGTRSTNFTNAGFISIAGGQLEFQGAGFTLSGLVTGAGGLTVNLNAGQTLVLSNTSNSYAGPTIVKGGYLSGSAYNAQGLPGGITQTPAGSLIMSNLTLQGGVFYSRYLTNKDLGAGPGQVQVLAGTSGFVHDAAQGGASGFTLDGSREIVWGSTYFNPTVFVHSLSSASNQTLNLANGFDLAGSTRTVMVGDATYNATNGVSQLGGNIRTSSGTAGLTKTGSGTLLLSGTNTYNGATTVSSGILKFANQVSLYNNTPASWTAANIVVANTGTLALNVGGGGQFTTGNVTTLLTNLGGANGTSTTGFAAGSSIGFDTTSASGGTFTVADNIANSSGTGGGAIGVVKLGTNTLVLSGTSNSYSGATIIRGGTLSLTGSLTGNTAISTANNNNGAGGTALNGILNQSAAGVISGATASFTQGSSGTSILAGNNSYGGGTTLNAGTLTVGHANALGTGTGTIALNGGTIQSNDATARTFTNAVTIGGNPTIGGTGNMTFSNTGSSALGGNRTITVTNSGTTATFAQSFTGTGNSITKAGAGTLVLSGNNSGVTGGTVLTGGTLILAGSTALPAGAITFGTTNTTLRFENDSNLSIGNTLTTSNRDLTRTLVVDRLTPGAAINLSFSSIPNIDSGTAASSTLNFQKGADITSGTPTITFTNGINSSDSNNHTFATVLNPTDVDVVINGINSSSRTRAYTFQGNSTGNRVTGTFANGSGTTVNKSGTGTWTFAGTSQYTGVTSINLGTLKFEKQTALYNNTAASWTAANINVKSGGTLAFSIGGTGEFTSGNVTTLLTNLAASSSATNGMNAGSNFGFDTTNASGGTFTIADVIADSTGASGGARGLTKLGTGTLILSNTNSYTGDTTVQAGSLVAGINSAVSTNGAFGNASSALVLGNASTAAGDAPAVLINGAFTVARAITVGSLTNTAAYNATIGGSNTTGTSIFSGNITLNTTAANYTATLQAATGGTTEFSTGTWTTNNKAIAIGSSGNAGIVRLNNNISTSGGISVNFGTLLLVSSDRLSDTTPVTVAGGTLDLGILTDTVDSFNMSSGSLTGTGTLTAATYSLTGGTLTAKLGAGAITVNGNVTFSAADRLNTSSSLLLQGGTLTLAGDESVASFQQTGGTIAGAFGINSASGFDLQSGTLSGNMGGTGGLTKTGDGTTVITGNNTYTGATTVTAGTLRVNGSTAAGSTVAVSAGATLGGTGTIGGAVNVSGVLSPGASIETLGTGTLSLTNGSSLVHELNSGVATAVGSDLLVVTGNLNLTGTVGLTLSDLTTPNVAFNVNDVFSIINYTGTWNGGLFTFGGNELANAEEFSFGLNTWRINYNAPTGGLNFAGEHVAGSFVNLTVIPEPNVAALIGAFGAILLLRRRR